MSQVQAVDRRQHASRLWQAATARQPPETAAAAASTTTTTADRFVLVTPTETDVDELMECITEAPAAAAAEAAHGDDAAVPPPNEDVVRQLAQALVTHCHIHNWRELANIGSHTEDVATTLLDKLSSNTAVCEYLTTTTTTNEYSTTETTTPAAAAAATFTVQGWVEQAQSCTCDEIMIEVCGDSAPAAILLSNVVDTGTPKDLAAWRGMADVLHDELMTKVQTQQTTTVAAAATDAGDGDDDDNDKETSTTTTIPSQQDLALWCDRAQQALEQLEWLDSYATPVVGVADNE